MQNLATARADEEEKELKGREERIYSTQGYEDDESEDPNDNPEIYESERLKDPLNDRVMKDVPRPPCVALSLDRVFPFKS